jgi:hypothetical protein
MSSDQDLIASYLHRLSSMPRPALAGFIEEAEAMLARGEFKVGSVSADLVDFAIQRLAGMAAHQSQA